MTDIDSLLSDAFDSNDDFSQDATYVDHTGTTHSTWTDADGVVRRIRVQLTTSVVRQDQRAGFYSQTDQTIAPTESITASVSKKSVRFPQVKEKIVVGGVSYEIRSRSPGVAGQWDLDLVPPKR